MTLTCRQLLFNTDSANYNHVDPACWITCKGRIWLNAMVIWVDVFCNNSHVNGYYISCSLIVSVLLFVNGVVIK